MDINYKDRMLDYYPPVIQSIKEYRVIVDTEYPEIEDLHYSMDEVLDNAYLMTMDENRLAQWEKILDIKILSNSSIEDRRDVVIARLRGQGKLNTNLINTIVNTFTGGKANSWVEDSTLYVEITTPPGNKQYRFENIENELKQKIPSHLNLVVTRNYYTWKDVAEENDTWRDVKNNFDTWEDVLLHSKS